MSEATAQLYRDKAEVADAEASAFARVADVLLDEAAALPDVSENKPTMADWGMKMRSFAATREIVRDSCLRDAQKESLRVVS